MSAVLPAPKPVAYQELTFSEKVQTVNRLYLLGMLGMLIGFGAIVFQMIHLSNQVAHTHPLIVRVDAMGRAEVVDLNHEKFVPRETELKYWVTLFTNLYFTRDHATVAKDYPQVGYLMTSDLFAQQQAEDAKSKWLEKFLSSGDDNQEVTVTNVDVQHESGNEYEAKVYFDKAFIASGGTETKREKYIETLRFIMDQSRVTNDMIPHNPLGFFVNHIKLDRAFQ